MPCEMLFKDSCFSTIGRSSGKELEALRRQCGHGCDPAFDYDADARHKLEAKKEKDREQKGLQNEDGNGAADAVSSLEQLRRALREVQGAGLGTGGEDDTEQEPEEAPLSPQDARRLREQKRNTSSFKAVCREDLQKMDIVNRFRAPPPGVYQPKEDLLSSRRRVKDVDFNARDRTRSRKVLETEQEVERLKAEGKPVDHLTKTFTNIELVEGIPENKLARKRLMDYDMSKVPPRPDVLKTSKIQFNDNSFTAGVLDGDKVRLQRQPEWDFAKSSTAPEKMREYYFQPGRYKCDLDVTRTKLEKKNIHFDFQRPRKPMRETVGRWEIIERTGHHLPDRSLARSCPALSNRLDVKVPNLSHYTERPSIINVNKTEWHDTSNAVVDHQVMQHRLTYDASEAMRPLLPKNKSTERFHHSLSRVQEVKKMRSYGEDITYTMRKEFSTRGPTSVETLEDWEIDNKPVFTRIPRVQVKDFTNMAGRDQEKRHICSPARQKDLRRAATFEREDREGDARVACTSFSDTAQGINALRHGRKFDDMSFEEA